MELFTCLSIAGWLSVVEQLGGGMANTRIPPDHTNSNDNDLSPLSVREQSIDEMLFILCLPKRLGRS
jgi:hypothetical protein